MNDDKFWIIMIILFGLSALGLSFGLGIQFCLIYM